MKPIVRHSLGLLLIAACAAVWLHAAASDALVAADPPGDPSIINTAHTLASLRVTLEK